MSKGNYFKIFLTLILILDVFQFNQASKPLKCGIDQLPKREPYFYKSKNSKRTMEDSTSYKEIRFYVDSEMIESQGNEQTSDVLEILDETLILFKRLLKVIPHETMKYSATIAKNYCGIDQVSDKLANEGVDADLILFPYFSDTLSDTVQAAASYCILESGTYRPLAGYVMINPKISFSMTNSKPYIKMLLLHEISHILVFHEQLFGYISKVQGFDTVIQSTVNGVIRNLLASPTVLEVAKKHFACDDLEGIELENQGGSGSAGSHWEARVMLGDYMIAFDYAENVVSDITLALFQDSGWYQVNYYTGGLFRFGKNKGCDFLKTKCINEEKTDFPSEYCLKSQQPRCSAGRLATGFCYLGKLSSAIPSIYQYFSDASKGGYLSADYCPITWANTQESEVYYATSCAIGKDLNNYPDVIGQEFGSDSICMVSSLLPTTEVENNLNYNDTFRAVCYKIECDSSEEKVIGYVGNIKFTCPKEGGALENPKGLTGIVNCPDYNQVCTSNKFCNNAIDCILNKIPGDDSSYEYSYSILEDYDVPSPLENQNKKRTSGFSIKLNSLVLALFLVILF